MAERGAYPDCLPLGSDAQELLAFAASLELINKIERGGCTRICATRQVYTRLGCMCLGNVVSELTEPKAGGRDG